MATRVSTCGWCGRVYAENDRMRGIIVSTVHAHVCYECALEWTSEPRLHLDLEPSPWLGTDVEIGDDTDN